MLLKKSIYFLAYFFSISSIIAQQIEVAYSISTNRNLADATELNNQNISKADITSFNESFELINTMKSYLKASQSQSFFWHENNMPSDVDDYKYRMAKIMVGHGDKYYTNLKEETVTRFFYAYDQNLMMNLTNFDLKWKLLNETKQIGNIKCYKASTIYTQKNSRGEQSFEVVAWYAPELQFNFGPIEFNGLPGLIMQLILDKFTYTVESFKISDEKFKIAKLPEARLITQQELNELGKEVRKKFSKND